MLLKYHKVGRGMHRSNDPSTKIYRNYLGPNEYGLKYLAKETTLYRHRIIELADFFTKQILDFGLA